MNIQEDTPDWWMQYMREGDYEKAWAISDQAIRARAGKPCWHLPRHLQYIWDGSPLNGKRILIRCYHGLGDTIQFIRYAPMVKERATSVIVWAQQELVPLLESMPGIDLLLPLHDGSPDVAFDLDVEVMELPHVFRTTLASIPAAIPYLSVKPQRHLSPGELSVGLVWKAGDWDQRRSVPFTSLERLGKIEGVKFFILQANAREAGWKEDWGTYDNDTGLADFARTIAGLDLLITVDSMPAHLAGALGIPVWTLLQANADWRWMEEREDSPWYPSMRLFRQEQQGQWEPVIDRVCTELQTFRKSFSNL